MELLVINGHDYGHFVESDGYGWSRNDIDSEKTKRTKGGKMRRKKICEKRKLSYKILTLPRSDIAALNRDLSQETFVAKVYDLDGEGGVYEGEFYCSSFSCSKVDPVNDLWGDGVFSLIEI